MSRLALASVLATAEAGTLAVTWKDCGAKHGKVTDLKPLTVETGTTTTVTGTGTVDEDVTAGHFTATVSALGTKLKECSGDGKKDIVCELPMGVGKITLKALPFPLKKGTVKIPVEVKTSKAIPTQLANVDVHVTATDQHGEAAICLDVHTAAKKVGGIAVEEAQVAFEDFKVQHRRAYATPKEEAERFTNFHASLERIQTHNANPDHSWERGLNQFSDMTDDEFRQAVLMAPQECSATSSTNTGANGPKAQDLPAHVDWRAKGVVSEVKNQGHCGSCWTFATAGCLEAHLAIKYDSWRAPRVSEQQLVDCAQAFDNDGCNGGLPSHAFEYIRYAGGLDTEFHYPYRGNDGNCSFEGPPDNKPSPFLPTSEGIGVTVPGGSVNLTMGDEDELKYVVATRGPVAIAYQVASDFRDYKSGVYTSTVCDSGLKDVNHAVLVVGYGNDPVSGLDYWLIKNSWDYTFGMEGFFKMEANKNMCGIADCMSYPDLYGINAAAMEAVAV